MKTITVIAYRRPEYLRRCLDALVGCGGISDYKVIVSIDGPSHSMASKDSPQRQCYYEAFYSGLSPQIITSETHIGVAQHPALVYDSVMHASDFNVALEEDCVLSPDALELADYFLKHFAKDYTFLSLGRLHDMVEIPDLLIEADEITSPWAWCFTKDAWRKISPYWDCKTATPIGWDWSLTYSMYQHHWRALAPHESRAMNIGRDGGTNGSPEWWDKTWGKAVCSRGCYHGPYKIRGGERPYLKDWMEAEINAHV